MRNEPGSSTSTTLIPSENAFLSWSRYGRSCRGVKPHSVGSPHFLSMFVSRGRSAGAKRKKQRQTRVSRAVVVALLLAVALGLLVRAWSMGLLMK